MAKNYKQESFVTPKNGYKVSDATAKWLDSIRIMDLAYTKIGNALDVMHSEEDAEKILENKYFPHWNALDDMLYEGLQQSIINHMVDLSNLNDPDKILI